MIPTGTLAWASITPGFRPPGPHPMMVIQSYTNGNVGVAFVTHSGDLLRVGVPILRKDVPSAFRDRGGPLSDDTGVLALVDDRGQRRIAIGEPLGNDQLRIGGSIILLTRMVHLPTPEWQPLRQRIRAALELPNFL